MKEEVAKGSVAVRFWVRHDTGNGFFYYDGPFFDRDEAEVAMRGHKDAEIIETAPGTGLKGK